MVTGRVALRVRVPERGPPTILTVEPGDVVGWSALVPPFARPTRHPCCRRSSYSSMARPCAPRWPRTTTFVGRLSARAQRSRAPVDGNAAAAARPVHDHGARTMVSSVRVHDPPTPDADPRFLPRADLGHSSSCAPTAATSSDRRSSTAPCDAGRSSACERAAGGWTDDKPRAATPDRAERERLFD